MSGQPLQWSRKPPGIGEREQLVRGAKLLAWLGVGWHSVEAGIAVGAGIVAGYIALIGFGADSLIESLAGIILLRRFAAARASSETAERRAQKLIGVSFYLMASYVGFEAVRSLLAGERPEASWIGIGLAAFTLATMPLLAIAKARVDEKLGSSATRSEGQQNMLCAYLSAALLVGLGANALLGLWWADPITALLIAGVAVKEGRQSWRELLYRPDLARLPLRRRMLPMTSCWLFFAFEPDGGDILLRVRRPGSIKQSIGEVISVTTDRGR